MSLATLRVEHADGLATVTLARPHRLNALDRRMAHELIEVMPRLDADDSVRAILLTGEGRAFCAGGDVHDLMVAFQGASFASKAAMVRLFNELMLRLVQIEKPVVAAVNGVAVGGGASLLLGCDVRYLSREAHVGFVYVRRGLSGADLGSTYLLPRLIGLARAQELLLTGRIISADEAERIGLAHRVLPPDDLLPAARALAAELAQGPTVALRMTKRALVAAFLRDLPSDLDLEGALQAQCMETADHREATAAFVEKRAPRFVGH
ncbi:MAG: enoyl-CoA hydratase/isomerase family protein [Chloroflexi bacterium]|nr:enoyl-CoA hydratase/isomerase family protein [Chloroflexota bacterium]